MFSCLGRGARGLSLLLVAACLAPAFARNLQQAFPPASAPAPGPAEGACPPPGLGPVPDFNVTEYISAPWFVLAQTPLVYQPVDQLFCTRAEYMSLDPADPLNGLRVVNFARQGSVDGPAVSTGAGPTLLARVPDRSQPSALSVGFDFPGASQLVGIQPGQGPYWVVAQAEDREWAIVMSGPPSVPGPAGCTWVPPTVSGMWLFSRTPDNRDAEDAMMAQLEGWGVDTSNLVTVQHEGCMYEDA